MVQRVLSAKNVAHARGATIVAGYLKILPLFLIIFPGMISRVLYPGTAVFSTLYLENGVIHNFRSFTIHKYSSYCISP